MKCYKASHNKRREKRKTRRKIKGDMYITHFFMKVRKKYYYES